MTMVLSKRQWGPHALSMSVMVVLSTRDGVHMHGALSTTGGRSAIVEQQSMAAPVEFM